MNNSGNKPMTKSQFLRKMKKAAKLNDIEMRHKRFDELMCRQLKSFGFEDGIKIFELSEKWYS